MSTPPANYRPRRADSVRFSTYYKVQWFDPTSLCWSDIQKQHPTPEAAIAAYPAGKCCRTMEVTRRAADRFDMKTHLIIAATLLLAGSALADTYRVHYSIRGSGRDITVQAESSAEARRTVMDSSMTQALFFAYPKVRYKT